MQPDAAGPNGAHKAQVAEAKAEKRARGEIHRAEQYESPDAVRKREERAKTAANRRARAESLMIVAVLKGTVTIEAQSADAD